MGIHSKECTIGEHVYTISQFPAEQATKVLVKLSHIVGESISLFASGVGDKQALKAIIPKALTAMIYRLDPDQTVVILKELMSCCIIRGQGSTTADKVYNTHFQGKLGDVMKLAVEVINFNYENFFDVVASLSPSSMGTTQDLK